jgi:hypothetical protein
MRLLAFFLVVLTLAAGCVLEDKPVIPEDGGVEAGPCGICELETPVCNDDLQCVACTADLDDFCTEMALVCKTGAFVCVACNANSDCNDAAAARCDTVQNECAGCEGEADCIGIEGRPLCDDGVCVECTPATEGVDCDGNSCDPATFMCTKRPLASRETCETCVSDSECKEAGNRCVAMTYQGASFPNGQTGFCLKTFAEGDPCERPYLVPLPGRESLSGPPAANYCGIDEANVTCRAVLALLKNVGCPMGADSECPESGLCRDFVDGIAEDRCTYLCGDADECKKPPVAGSTCGSSGSGSSEYCGG